MIRRLGNPLSVSPLKPLADGCVAPTVSKRCRNSSIPHKPRVGYLPANLETAAVRIIPWFFPLVRGLVTPRQLVSSMQWGIERRMNPRHRFRVGAEGTIWRNSRVGCTVRDFSPAGAGLLLPNDVPLPTEFDLTFDRATRHCILEWRQLGRVGLRFKSN
jgi:hypothetical protein